MKHNTRVKNKFHYLKNNLINVLCIHCFVYVWFLDSTNPLHISWTSDVMTHNLLMKWDLANVDNEEWKIAKYCHKSSNSYLLYTAMMIIFFEMIYWCDKCVDSMLNVNYGAHLKSITAENSTHVFYYIQCVLMILLHCGWHSIWWQPHFPFHISKFCFDPSRYPC